MRLESADPAHARPCQLPLFRSYGVDCNLIRLRIEAHEAFLSVETAVPCGLIVNELLSNCLKHAFPDKRRGEVRIQVGEHREGWLTLVVADNGIGLPQGINIETSDTLGLQLVRTLTRQLNGQLEVASNGCAEFKVRFPVPKAP